MALLPYLALGAFAPEPSGASSLTATQIVERNAAARGGLDAWRAVRTMLWQGHMKTADGPAPSMAFDLQQVRPNKTRFELAVMNQHSVRVYDGSDGWSVRTSADRGPRVVPFSPQELEYAQKLPGIDGLLIDSAAKGNVVKLEGVEQVDGHKAFRLEVVLKSGASQHVWVDTQTYLEVQADRTSYTQNGTPVKLTVLYHDYKEFNGLQIPTTIVSGAGSSHSPDVMVIERVTVNAPLDERAFLRPGATPPGSKRSAMAHRPMGRAMQPMPAGAPPTQPSTVSATAPGTASTTATPDGVVASPAPGATATAQ